MLFSALPQNDDPLVLIRPLSAEDLSPWAALIRHPSVYEHTSWNLPSADELAKFIWQPAERAASSPLRLAIVSRESGRFVGTVGFHTVSPENRTAELAYELSPAEWGRGIATRLCGALARWGHESAGLIRIQATALISNKRSIRVLERCAFQREGLLRSYRMVRGIPGDFYIYSSIKSVSEGSGLR
jgi:[ribosomal protein S5]-alanine N-acetyltransferase